MNIGHISYVLSCDFDCTGQLLVSSSMDSTIRVWHNSSPEATFVFNTRLPCTSVSFFPGTSHLILAAKEDAAYVYDIRMHRCEIFENTTKVYWIVTWDLDLWDRILINPCYVLYKYERYVYVRHAFMYRSYGQIQELLRLDHLFGQGVSASNIDLPLWYMEQQRIDQIWDSRHTVCRWS